MKGDTMLVIVLFIDLYLVRKRLKARRVIPSRIYLILPLLIN